MKCNAEKNSVIIVLLLMLVACGSQNISDKEYYERARDYHSKNQLRAVVIELKNALQVNPNNIEARILLGQTYVELGDGVHGEKELKRAIKIGTEDDTEKVNLYLARAMLLQRKYQALLDKFENENSLEFLVIIGEAYIGLRKIELAKQYVEKARNISPNSESVQFALSKLAIVEREYDEAHKILNSILENNPQHRFAWRQIGVIEMQQGNMPDAENAFRKVIELEDNKYTPLEIEARTWLTQALLVQNKLEEASNEIEKIRTKAPKYPVGIYLSAMMNFKKGNFDAARTELLTVLSLVDEHLPSELLLGATLYALAEYEQAGRVLSKYVNQVPSHLHARKMLAAIRMKQKRAGEAVELLTFAEEDSPDDAGLLAMIAQASISSGNLSEGAKYYKKALKIDPNNPTIRAELASVFMRDGAFDMAISELEAIADKHAQPRDVLLVFAHLKKREFTEAKKLASKLLEHSPGPQMQTLLGGVELMSGSRVVARNNFIKALSYDDNYVPALLNLGRLDLEDSKFDDANSRFNAVLKQDPKNLKAIFGLAQVAELNGNGAKALQLIEKGRALNPDAIEPRLVLARYYLKTRDTTKAVELAEELLKIDKQNPNVLILAGKVYVSAGNTTSAIEVFESLTEILPNESRVYFELAIAQAKIGLNDQARRNLSKVISLNEDYEQAYFALANLEIKERNYDEALSLADKLKRLKVESHLGHMLAGDVYIAKKDYRKASGEYQKALKKKSLTMLAIKLGNAYSVAKDYSKAISFYNRWLDENPEDATIKMVLAQEYQKNGEPRKAVKIMEQMLSENPDNAVILNNLAYLYHEQGNPRALEIAERAYELNPNSAAIADTLAWILVQKGLQQDRAEELLRNAVEGNPTALQIKYHLAVALLNNGKTKESKTILAELLSSQVDFEGRDEAKKMFAQ